MTLAADWPGAGIIGCRVPGVQCIVYRIKYIVYRISYIVPQSEFTSVGVLAVLDRGFGEVGRRLARCRDNRVPGAGCTVYNKSYILYRI